MFGIAGLSAHINKFRRMTKLEKALNNSKENNILEVLNQRIESAGNK